MEERIRELEAEVQRWQAIAEGIADDAAKQTAHLRTELAAAEKDIRFHRWIILLMLALGAVHLILSALGGLAL